LRQAGFQPLDYGRDSLHSRAKLLDDLTEMPIVLDPKFRKLGANHPQHDRPAAGQADTSGANHLGLPAEIIGQMLSMGKDGVIAGLKCGFNLIQRNDFDVVGMYVRPVLYQEDKGVRGSKTIEQLPFRVAQLPTECDACQKSQETRIRRVRRQGVRRVGQSAECGW
jgi:hypothetical protein